MALHASGESPAGDVPTDLPASPGTAPASFWALFVLALALRIPGLFSVVNPDELHLIRESRPGPEYALFDQWRHDVHPPLGFVTFALWMKAGTADWWLRLPSLVFTMLSFYVLHQFLVGAMGARIALATTALLAFAPSSIMYSTWAKHYPLATLLGLLILAACHRGLAGDRRWPWIYVPAAILGLYWHYSIILVLVAANVLFGVALWRRQAAIALKHWVAAQAVVLLAFAPWFPAFWEQIASDRGIVMGTPLVNASRLLKVPYFFFSFSLGESIQPWELLPVAVGFLLFTTMFLGGLRRAWLAGPGGVGVLIFFLVPLVIGSLKRVTVPKHLYFTVPLYCAILAAFLCSIRSRARLALLLVGLSGVWGYSLFNIYTARHLHDTSMEVPWKEIASKIRTSRVEGDGLLMYPDFEIHSLGHYYPDAFSWHVPIAPGSDEEVMAQLRRLPESRRIWALLAAGNLDAGNRHREIITRFLAERYVMTEESEYLHEERLQWTLRGVFLKEGAIPYTYLHLRRFDRR